MSTTRQSEIIYLFVIYGILRKTKICLVQSLVFSVFSQAREKRGIDTFDMWCWRRILLIPWRQRISSVSTRTEIGMDKHLSFVCQQHFLGHITRRAAVNTKNLQSRKQSIGKDTEEERPGDGLNKRRRSLSFLSDKSRQMIQICLNHLHLRDWSRFKGFVQICLHCKGDRRSRPMASDDPVFHELEYSRVRSRAE